MKCNKCALTKPEGDFSVRKKSKSGRSSACRDCEASARLVQKYGITLTEYNKRLAEQGGVCRICEKPPGSVRLHVDHDHTLRYLKVDSFKLGKGKWVAYCGQLDGTGATKSEAIRKVRNHLKTLSVRGILCWGCNAGLKSYADSAQSLASASQYLVRYEDSKRIWYSGPTAAATPTDHAPTGA
jgi:hypothetical protein